MAAVAIAWSFFAFGAVYPWAAPPLLILSLIAMALGRAWPEPRRLADAAALAALAVALLHLLPLPPSILSVLSPDAAAFRAQVDLEAAAGAWHPLSLDAGRTTVSLMLAASAFALFLATRRLALVHGRHLVRWIAWMAIAGACLGLGKSMLAPGERVYGFWMPRESGAAPFGPIINRNHFAAWSVLAAAMLAGGFFAHCARRYEHTAARRRLIAMLSDSQGLWLLFSLALLTAALVFTASRAGAIGLVAAFAAMALLTRRRVNARALTFTAAVGIVCLAAALSWASPERLFARLGGEGGLGMRSAIWDASAAMAARYPIAGVGLGAFPAGMAYYQPPPRTVFFNHAHNQYLELAAEGGALLGLPLLLFAAAVARQMWRGLARDARWFFWLRAGAGAALAGVLALSIWESPFRTPATLMLAAIAAGLAAADPQRDVSAR